MANERRDVHPLRQRVNRIEVLGVGLEHPRQSEAESLDRHALDALECPEHDLAVLGTRWRDPEAAVAHDGSGYAVPRRRREVTVPEHLRVVVRVRIDEAW